MSIYKEKIQILIIIFVFVVIFTVVFAEKHDYIEVNYDIDKYIFLHVNETLELICKNKLNGNPPSWTYPRRMANNPRVKFNIDVGESRMVISKAEAEDAGKYKCEIEHDYEGKTHHFNKEIQVVVNEIREVKVDDENGIKLLCTVIAYPTPDVTWKIEYDNDDLNPPTEAPDLDDHYWMPSEPKVVVDKSNGRWTLRQYNGVNNAELSIANYTENDNGKYYCVASNLCGEKYKDCTVNRTKRGVEIRGTPSTVSPSKNHNSSLEISNPQEPHEGLEERKKVMLITLLFLHTTLILIVSFIWYMRRHQKRNERMLHQQDDIEVSLSLAPKTTHNDISTS